MQHDEPTESRGWPEAPGSTKGQPIVRVLRHASAKSIRWAMGKLVSREIRSVAILREVPGPKDVWIAREWWDRLVTDTPLHEIAGVDERLWRQDSTHNQYFIWESIFASATIQPPAIVDTAIEFGDLLRTAHPVAVLVDVADIDLGDVKLFRGYSAGSGGGSSALMSLCGAAPGVRELFLRNPAALELDDSSADTSSAAYFRNTHEIEIRALGLSSTPSDEPGFTHFREPDIARRAWSERESHPSHFWIIVELTALVDPEVIIPVGSIFEQQSVNGVQTLASAASTSLVIRSGESKTVAVPAWCLNQQLKPPSGQPLQATPLRARYNPNTSQDDVWRDRTRIVPEVST